MSEDFVRDSHPIEIFGIWAYKIDGKVDYSEAFPPRSLEDKITLVAQLPGEKHSLEEINTNWLKDVLAEGMTHIMLGHGSTCKVMEADSVKKYLEADDEENRIVTCGFCGESIKGYDLCDCPESRAEHNDILGDIKKDFEPEPESTIYKCPNCDNVFDTAKDDYNPDPDDYDKNYINVDKTGATCWRCNYSSEFKEESWKGESDDPNA